MLQIVFSFMVENNFCVCFLFLFKHVAQISIALGRHTLPHVRTRKNYKTCIYDAVTFKEITCGVGLAAVCIAGILPMYLKVIREIQCACRISSEKIHCRKVVSNLYNLGLNMCPTCTFMSCLNVILWIWNCNVNPSSPSTGMILMLGRHCPSPITPFPPILVLAYINPDVLVHVSEHSPFSPTCISFLD